MQSGRSKDARIFYTHIENYSAWMGDTLYIYSDNEKKTIFKGAWVTTGRGSLSIEKRATDGIADRHM